MNKFLKLDQYGKADHYIRGSDIISVTIPKKVDKVWVGERLTIENEEKYEYRIKIELIYGEVHLHKEYDAYHGEKSRELKKRYTCKEISFSADTEEKLLDKIADFKRQVNLATE